MCVKFFNTGIKYFNNFDKAYSYWLLMELV